MDTKLETSGKFQIFIEHFVDQPINEDNTGVVATEVVIKRNFVRNTKLNYDIFSLGTRACNLPIVGNWITQIIDKKAYTTSVQIFREKSPAIDCVATDTASNLTSRFSNLPRLFTVVELTEAINEPLF